MSSPVYFKTARGKEEVEFRRLGLSTRARRFLILVDGERDREQLLRMSGLGAAEADQWLGELLRSGMISATGQTQARAPVAPAAPAAPRQPPAAAVPEPRTAAQPAPKPAPQPAVQPAPQPAPDPQQSNIDTVRLQIARVIMLETTQQYMPLVGADIRRRVEEAHDLEKLQSCVTRWHLALRESRQGREVAESYLNQVRQALYV